MVCEHQLVTLLREIDFRCRGALAGRRRSGGGPRRRRETTQVEDWALRRAQTVIEDGERSLGQGRLELAVGALEQERLAALRVGTPIGVESITL